ncbi:MAG: protein kinase [Pseudomonadota bacterium]
MNRFCPECDSDLPAGQPRCPVCGGDGVETSRGDRVGEIIDGRYTIQRVLGHGGMGVVYVARQKYLGRDVALKVLRRELAADESYVKRFLREARAVASLKSPHTITVHEFGITPDRELYFSMELLEGVSLATLIRREAPLHLERAAALLSQACESLAEAHAGGIVHRDLKPDNLFISAEPGGREFVTVLDFGIAKAIGEAERLTATGMICGTPHYLSPEQASGLELTPSADLYALGTILFEMLSGRTPFQGTAVVQLLMDQVRTPPPRLRDTRTASPVPEALDAFVTRTLAKDPADRPADAEAFRREMAKAVAGKASSLPETVSQLPEPATSAPGEATLDEATADTLTTDTTGMNLVVPGRSGTLWIVGLVLLGLIGGALALWRPWEATGVPVEGPAPRDVVEEETPATPDVVAEEIPPAPDVVAEEIPPAPDVVMEEIPPALDMVVEEIPLAPDMVVEEIPPAPDVIVEVVEDVVSTPDVVADVPSAPVGAEAPPTGKPGPKPIEAVKPLPQPDDTLFKLEKVPTEDEVKKDLFNLEEVPTDSGSKR